MTLEYNDKEYQPRTFMVATYCLDHSSQTRKVPVPRPDVYQYQAGKSAVSKT